MVITSGSPTILMASSIDARNRLATGVRGSPPVAGRSAPGATVASVSLETALALLGAISGLAWLGIALHPARPWDLRPVGDDEPPSPDPAAWPSVGVLVPARNEAAMLPHTLPALLAQDYPGEWRVVVVDDRSQDGTAAVAEALGGPRLTVVRGAPLPSGWAGKVWALEQGARAAGDPEYLLLTDADIRHEPGSLRRLVAESLALGLDLDSRMARLRTRSAAERLLIPPFLFFFNLLYPMRWVGGRRAAAAGGCILLRRATLERAGGFEAIRGEVIDDVRLARAVRRVAGRLRLAVSRREVVSLREYGSTAAIWRMVRRSAFDELRYSWPLLAVTVAGLLLLFAVPPGVLVAGLVLGDPLRTVLVPLGAGAWALMTALFLPTVRLFGLSPLWALTFPAGGLLYGAMTVDSALHHAAGRRSW